MNFLPIIAIVGRPNTGKSTLFNRLIGKRHAITLKEEGTTRDRIHQKFNCNGYECMLVDTGGIADGNNGNIEENIQIQAQIAIKDADIVIFIIDATTELTSNDFLAANILRKSGKNIILVANKCDNSNIEERAFNIYELGFGDATKISAIHDRGIKLLESQIENRLKDLKFKKEKNIEDKKNVINICILGEPNAGKSSLINAFLGEKKLIVSEIPGTTRDSTDSEIIYNDKKYNLIDTAGLRRPGKRRSEIEKISAIRAISSIEKCDVVALLIDGSKPIPNQACHIAEDVLKENKGLILTINKIDLVETGEEPKTHIINQLRLKFAFTPWAPVIFISAKNKKNIFKIFELADSIMQERNKNIKTSELNSFMKKITQKHLPASAKFKKPHFSYIEQIDINPPKFILFFKNAKNLHFSYPRYIENQLRKEFGFNGTPIVLKFKEKIEKKRERIKK